MTTYGNPCSDPLSPPSGTLDTGTTYNRSDNTLYATYQRTVDVILKAADNPNNSYTNITTADWSSLSQLASTHKVKVSSSVTKYNTTTVCMNFPANTDSLA